MFLKYQDISPPFNTTSQKKKLSCFENQTNARTSADFRHLTLLMSFGRKMLLGDTPDNR